MIVPLIILMLHLLKEKTQSDDNLKVEIGGKQICTVLRNFCKLDSQTDRLGVGRRGKLTGTSDGKAGIIDFNGRKADEIIQGAMDDFCALYKKENNGEEFDRSRSFPSDTWFRFVKDRKPVILIYLIEIGVDPDDSTQKKQIDEFRSKMGDVPAVGFAMGLPRNDTQMAIGSTRYKANKVYNWFERDEIMAEGEEEWE